MLTHLSISNYAIVDQLDLDLAQGMTVITGETGAGKSIMLDALGLAIGDRAEPDSVRTGSERADIRATFDLVNCPDAQAWLTSRELDAGDECILRRTITREGRSRGYINGTPSPLADLRQIGEMLLDIHSQHEHQSLLKPATHRRLLDGYAGTNALAATVSQIWRQWNHCHTRIQTLRNASEEQSARLQLLSYQVEELEQLNLGKDELEQLEQEQKQLANATSSLQACDQVLTLCAEDDNSNIVHQLSACQHLLAELNLDSQPIQDAIELISSAQIQVEECCNELRHFMDRFDDDPERLPEIEKRLSAIYSLARKHHIQPSELHSLHNELQKELASLQNSDDQIDQLQEELQLLEKQYKATTDKLSVKRQKGALKLAKAVIRHIRDLGMPAGEFKVELTTINGEFRPHGNEDIQFLVTSNPGMPARPLHRVASGGELSRISLAIQVITAKSCQIPTLVFDEVDVGIGGGTAEIVGRLLRELGSHGQVLCVTHQPQVASQGHQHLHVSKQHSKATTRTHIHELHEECRTQEIARMLGGITLTDHTVAHAREMIERAQTSAAS